MLPDRRVSVCFHHISVPVQISCLVLWVDLAVKPTVYFSVFSFSQCKTQPGVFVLFHPSVFNRSCCGGGNQSQVYTLKHKAVFVLRAHILHTQAFTSSCSLVRANSSRPHVYQLSWSIQDNVHFHNPNSISAITESCHTRHPLTFSSCSTLFLLWHFVVMWSFTLKDLQCPKVHNPSLSW